MAGSIIDVLTHPEIMAKAKETFKAEVAGATYRSLLPEGQKPDITANAEEMAKYRDIFKAQYFKGEIKFQ